MNESFFSLWNFTFMGDDILSILRQIRFIFIKNLFGVSSIIVRLLINTQSIYSVIERLKVSFVFSWLLYLRFHSILDTIYSVFWEVKKIRDPFTQLELLYK